MSSEHRLPATLATVVVCPGSDHGTLTEAVHAGARVLRCVSCGLMFPVDGGIPVLLLSHAIKNPVVSTDSDSKEQEPDTGSQHDEH